MFSLSDLGVQVDILHRHTIVLKAYEYIAFMYFVYNAISINYCFTLLLSYSL